nr:hypothetical protein [Mycobacterium tuberculosis]
MTLRPITDCGCAGRGAAILITRLRGNGPAPTAAALVAARPSSSPGSAATAPHRLRLRWSRRGRADDDAERSDEEERRS